MQNVHALSYRAESDFQPPAPPELSYLPFQRAGIEYALTRRNTLIADDMGLGKTIQAIGFCNVVRPQTVLIVCPASLKLNWVREWNKWTTTGLLATVKKSACWVLNYDLLVKHGGDIKSVLWDVLILDEAHYLKNPKANRTRQVFGGRGYSKETKGLKVRISGVRPIRAGRILALTGTPLENRPMEFYPILHYLLPEVFSDPVKFGIRYCRGWLSNVGWDFSGASNLEELQQLLRSTLMIRRLKSQVLKELPPKTRQIIELDSSAPVRVLNGFIPGSDELLSDEEYAQAVKLLDESEARNPKFHQISEYRKELAMVKLPMVIAHTENVINQVGKVILFCHHREFALALKEHFKSSVMVIGGMSLKAKDEAVQRFRNDSKTDLFIGNFNAAGVGLTLTESSTVLIAETVWKPGEFKQAEDRAHRIGQNNRVLIQHLVLARSWESRMCKTVVRKMEVLDAATDKLPDLFS